MNRIVWWTLAASLVVFARVAIPRPGVRGQPPAASSARARADHDRTSPTDLG